MKLGIKVGPRTNSIKDIQETNPDFVEVWYNSTRPDDYNELFSYLTAHHIETGIHFWGALPNQTAVNISYPDPEDLQASMSMIQKTIDTANHHAFSYVNIHPGSYAKVLLDMNTMRFTANHDPIDEARATQTFLSSYAELSTYAQSKNVLLTVETVPHLVAHDYWSNPRELRVKNANPIYELSNTAIIEAARHNMYIANDFGHTAANFISDDANAVWQYLYDVSTILAPQTKLIHLGFIISPYNGTDFHDHFDNPLFETSDAVPNKNHMIELLKLFQNRDDIFSLVEPNGQHPKNFFLAQKILADAGVRTPQN